MEKSGNEYYVRQLSSECWSKPSLYVNVFSLPDLSDDDLWLQAEQFNISGEQRFRMAVISGRVDFFDKTIAEYYTSNKRIGFFEQWVNKYYYGINKLQELIIEDDFIAFRNAAAGGHLEIMKRLVELARANQVTVKYMIEYHNHSAFIIAIKNGHSPVVDYLMEGNDDAKQMLELADHYGAYRWAQEKGHQATIGLLDQYAVEHEVVIKNKMEQLISVQTTLDKVSRPFLTYASGSSPLVIN